MKRFAFILLVSFSAILSCKKTDTTTNNTLFGSQSKPHFLVNGLTDIALSNDFDTYGRLELTIQYNDSAQETVTLAVSGLPAGIDMDTTWMYSGLPTFTTTLTIFDTTAVGVKPGVYPLTLIATTASGIKNQYSFNLDVLPMPSAFLGKYNNCSFLCGGSGTAYTDSLYADPVIQNKVWFKNFGNTGSSAYGLVTLVDLSPSLIIPEQTIGGVTYSSGTTSPFTDLRAHAINLNVHIGTSGGCPLVMH